MLITALRKDRESIYQRGFIKGFQEGFERGLQLGKQKDKINIAKILLAEHFETTMIAELLQLPLEEIEQLQYHQITDVIHPLAYQ